MLGKRLALKPEIPPLNKQVEAYYEASLVFALGDRLRQQKGGDDLAKWQGRRFINGEIKLANYIGGCNRCKYL